MSAFTINWPLFGLCLLLSALIVAARICYHRVKRDEVDRG